MFRAWIVICVMVLFNGCVQVQLLPYLDQVLVLKEFGEEKDAQNKYVTNADAHFDQLLATVKSGDIVSYKTEKDIIKAFGPPLLSVTDSSGGKAFKRSLYHYVIWRKGPQKVYFYYDESGCVVKWENPS